MTDEELEAIRKRWDIAMDQISMDSELHELNWLVSQDVPKLIKIHETLHIVKTKHVVLRNEQGGALVVTLDRIDSIWLQPSIRGSNAMLRVDITSGGKLGITFHNDYAANEAVSFLLKKMTGTYDVADCTFIEADYE